MSKNGTLKRKDIKEDIKLIENTNNYYVSTIGDIYKLTPNNLFLKIKLTHNPNGYMYTAFDTKEGKRITRRVHRLVALAFIPNPNNYDIVGHRDNNKSNNNVKNLYWTTISENTKKAFDDKLAINAKGYEDSQSHPIIVYNKDMQEIDRVGSMKQGAKKYGVSCSTIARHCNGEIKGKTRCGYYFRYDKSFK